jgi:hypothetical protein
LDQDRPKADDPQPGRTLIDEALAPRLEQSMAIMKFKPLYRYVHQSFAINICSARDA